MHDIVLTGLNGANPLAFLAALGALEVISTSDPNTTLLWQHSGSWRAVLHSSYASMDSMIEQLERDREQSVNDPALALEYSGKRDLKPAPIRFRQFLNDLVGHSSPTNRRSVDWATAFATDVAVDNNGNTKPTALHFTAGQQQFLQMALDLVANVTRDDFREALCGPWKYERSLPVMGWDATSSRDYALRANDPSTDKKLGVPGADWLALRGLIFLPTVPRGLRVITAGCVGGWKDGRFRWPLWTVPLSAPVVRSVLTLDIERMTKPERTARAIGAVLSSGIRRSDQGGYGSFAPASVI